MTASRVYINRKFERPFSRSHALHITLRTKIRGLRSRRILSWLAVFLPQKANYFGAKLFHFAILDGHLHLLVQAHEKEALNGFLRVISGVIARKVLRAEKNNPKGIQMWIERPYSRILSWGREFRNVMAYVERNALEGAKKIPFIPRNQRVVVALRERIIVSLTKQPLLQI